MPQCKHMYPNALTGFTAVEAVFDMEAQRTFEGQWLPKGLC